MMRLELAEVVAAVQQLPALPVVVHKVLQTFEQADPDIDALAHEIEHDKALASRVLRLANSPFYALQRQIGTVHDAVTVLGFRNVRATVTGVAVMRCFADAKLLQGINVERFWCHGSMVALAARVLARQTRQCEDFAFTAGLVHDIGILALLARYSTQMAAVFDYKATHGCAQRAAEGDVLGIDHAQVGHALLDHWHFPTAICDAVLGHHIPDDCGALADVVHVADAVAHAVFASGVVCRDNDELVPPIRDVAFIRLGITVAMLKTTMAEVARNYEHTRQAIAG